MHELTIAIILLLLGILVFYLNKLIIAGKFEWKMETVFEVNL